MFTQSSQNGGLINGTVLPKQYANIQNYTGEKVTVF